MNVAKMILDLAEDDYIGLWEFVWRANTLEAPRPLAARIAEIRPILDRLIKEGMVDVYVGTRFNGDERRIPADGASMFLDAPSNWVQPVDGRDHARVVATDQAIDR